MSRGSESSRSAPGEQALHRSLKQTYTRIHRATLHCDWEGVESSFRGFCKPHSQFIPQWFVDEYVFQAMRLWANGQLGQLIRHFSSFLNRAAGASLVDAAQDAAEIRDALSAPSLLPVVGPRTRPANAPRPVDVDSPPADSQTSAAPKRAASAAEAPAVTISRSASIPQATKNEPAEQPTAASAKPPAGEPKKRPSAGKTDEAKAKPAAKKVSSRKAKAKAKPAAKKVRSRKAEAKAKPAAKKVSSRKAKAKAKAKPAKKKAARGRR